MNIGSLVKSSLVALCCLSLPAAACRPFGSYQFAEDSSGGIWFTEGDNNAVSRMAPDGTIRAYKLPTPHAEPSSVALDRKGNVWFVETDGFKLGRIGRDGRITEYPVTDGKPFLVAVDERDNAWFTQMSDHESAGNHADHGSHGIAKIGIIDRQGRMRSYPLPEGWPSSIAFSRGQVLVAMIVPGGEKSRPKGRLARLSRDGRWKIEKAWDDSCPRNLLTDGRGAVHFSDGCRGVVGVRAPDGRLAEWLLPSGVRIQQMSFARDGTLWFTDRKHLGRIDRSGKVTFADRPENDDATMAVLATRNGDIVFSEFYNYNINRLTKSGELVEHLVNVDERNGAREVKEGEACYVQFAARITAKAEMDKNRAEEVKGGRFKPDGAGTEKLVEQKCLVCHDARRLLLSRRNDWTPSITRMHAYRDIRKVEPLTADETTRLVHYFNEYYGLSP